MYLTEKQLHHLEVMLMWHWRWRKKFGRGIRDVLGLK